MTAFDFEGGRAGAAWLGELHVKATTTAAAAVPALGRVLDPAFMLLSNASAEATGPAAVEVRDFPVAPPALPMNQPVHERYV